jgi:hypothetical protein
MSEYDQLEQQRQLLVSSHAVAKRCADELAEATSRARRAADDLEEQLRQLCDRMRKLE